jgi:hypothetical protein
MNEQVTVLVVPRDRFSSVLECTQSILDNTSVPFRLVFLDFGYSRSTLARLKTLCGSVPTEIVSLDLSIPMVAFKEYLPKVTTRYLAWVDNDTFVAAGWMEALLNRAAKGAKVIMPLTLEREGLDIDPRKIPLRNHVSHSELRKVNVAGTSYVFDYKPFRRAAPEEIPQEGHTIDFFELHTFFAETAVLRQMDYPPMVVREHIDLGMQFHRLGVDIWCEPKSRVHFDNIHERPTFQDLRFFFYRWSDALIDRSHELFEQRWGYRFYNERFMRNWAFRRKVYSVCRFLGLPQQPSDFISRVLKKLFRSSEDKKFQGDPLPVSERVLPLRSTVSR